MSLRREDGFTLTELLIGASMMLILMGVMIPVLFATIHLGDDQQDRITALDHDRVAFDSMTRELREANCVAYVTPGRSIVTIEPSTAPAATAGSCTTGNAHQAIRYDCSVAGSAAGKYDCVRTDVVSGARRVLIEDVINTSPLVVNAVSSAGRAIAASGTTPASQTVRVTFEKRPVDNRPVVRLQGSVVLRAVGI